jgi:pseudouridine synthase
MSEIRIQKYLSAAGICSRRKAESHVRAGRVRINGKTVTVLGTKINPDIDRIEVDGRRVGAAAQKIYIALNKPKGYVTSCDHPGQDLVIDLVDLPDRIYPIGRLDKDSTGLLLLTNDGRLHHQLSHPSFDHEKEYEVTVQHPIEDGVLQQLSQGIVLKGVKTRPARVERLSGRRFRIILKEGRNRQIRRMVSTVGHKVTRLKRLRMANVRLGNLPPGAWRHITAAEKKKLLQGI